MKRIAVPMIGGLFTSFLMELLVYPAIYYRSKWRAEVRQAAASVCLEHRHEFDALTVAKEKEQGCNRLSVFAQIPIRAGDSTTRLTRV